MARQLSGIFYNRWDIWQKLQKVDKCLQKITYHTSSINRLLPAIKCQLKLLQKLKIFCLNKIFAKQEFLCQIWSWISIITENGLTVTFIGWYMYVRQWLKRVKSHGKMNLSKLPRFDSHSQTWRPFYDMVWSWWFILAMVWSWQDHGMVIMKCSMIMVWPSWKIAWPSHGDHGHYYNVVRTLIIQPTLLISAQVIVRYFLTRNMMNKHIKNYHNDIY